MRYKVYSPDGELINTIIADEDVVESICSASGLSYEQEAVEISAEELREIAYNTEECIPWEDKLITVTAAAQLWQYYAAEGSEIATRLTALIAAAKEEIRSRIHD